MPLAIFSSPLQANTLEFDAGCRAMDMRRSLFLELSTCQMVKVSQLPWSEGLGLLVCAESAWWGIRWFSVVDKCEPRE